MPVMVKHLYDMNWIIDEKGFLGEMLKSLFGYNGNPSLLEVTGYLGYMTFALISFLRTKKGRPADRLEMRKAREKSPMVTEELPAPNKG